MADVDLEKKHAVWLITLNRPQQGNTFSLGMVDSWVEMLEAFSATDDAKVLVITGSGGTFSRGLELSHLPIDAEAHVFAAAQRRMHRVARCLSQIDKPVIAAINGAAVGAGFDMALLCDIRFAAASASVAEGYIRGGLVPGNGGAWLLARCVGTSQALELLWTGREISAAEAQTLGIVNRVVPDERLMAETMSFATELAGRHSGAMAVIKRAVYAAADTNLLTALDAMASHMAVVQSTEETRRRLAEFRRARQLAPEEAR